MSKERMSPVPLEDYTESQQEARESFEKIRKEPLFGPFERLIRSPVVLTHAQSLGEYLRYRSGIGNQLSEMVILITAKVWNQHYEWSLHQPIAIQSGVPKTTADAIALGKKPEGMNEEETACYDFSIELHKTRQVSDETYARALSHFGEAGIVDLTALNGYYAFLAMQLNVMRVNPVDGGPTLPSTD